MTPRLRGPFARCTAKRPPFRGSAIGVREFRTARSAEQPLPFLLVSHQLKRRVSMHKRLMLMSLALVVLTSCGKLSSPVAPVPPSNVVSPSRVKDPSEAIGVDAANVIMTMVRAHLAGAAPDSGWVV